jgi:hypothetical protein
MKPEQFLCDILKSTDFNGKLIDAPSYSQSESRNADNDHYIEYIRIIARIHTGGNRLL